MSLAERDVQLLDQPVGDIGGGGKPRIGGGAHALLVDREVFNHAGHRGKRQAERIQRVEGDFLVFLHVLGIGERQALHHHHQAGQCAHDAADLGADQLGRIRVALLRHDRAAGGELVGKLDEAELRRRPDHQFFGEAGQVHGAERCRRQRLEDEVAIGDGVERIGGRPVEAKRLRRHVAVDRVGRSAERGGTERVLVEALPRILEAAGVASQHFHVGEEVVAEGHRLGVLQVGEARHDGRRFEFGAPHQRQLQSPDLHKQRIDGIAHVQPEVGRHLVVARAGRVQPAGSVADQFLEPAFDIHVDVFEGAREREFPCVDFGAYRL